MNFSRIVLLTAACLSMMASAACTSGKTGAPAAKPVPATAQETNQVVVGAARTSEYVPLLKGKRIALLSNQTGIVGDKHVLDIMLEHGLQVVTIFSPEHGFRGKADAGEKVASGVDEKTGIPIASLYDGKSPMPSRSTMDKCDVVVIDLQDVGLRFYTYYVTMIHLMDAAAQYGKQVVVLDRPNPNGMTVDGELARMANGEGWLQDGKRVDLTVIPCLNYTHRTRYKLPVAPSPNLPNMLSVYLYPSLCYFEGTTVSLGRGTDFPFQCYGHPDMKGYKFTFTPSSRFGAKTPPQLGKLCHGVDLRGLDPEQVIAAGINLDYVIDAYNNLHRQGKPFLLKEGERNFFNLLMGNTQVYDMIVAGKSAKYIKATWQKDIEKFKAQRKPYLLYKE